MSHEKEAAVSKGLVPREQLALGDAGCSLLGPPLCWEVSAVSGNRWCSWSQASWGAEPVSFIIITISARQQGAVLQVPWCCSFTAQLYVRSVTCATTCCLGKPASDPLRHVTYLSFSSLLWPLAEKRWRTFAAEAPNPIPCCLYPRWMTLWLLLEMHEKLFLWLIGSVPGNTWI